MRALKEGRTDTMSSDLLDNSRNLFKIFVNTTKVREMYGSEVAIYYEWMNHLLKWLVLPGAMAIVVYIANTYFYTVDNSPFAAVFSLIMSLWGVAYTVSWKRKCRSFYFKWDDYAMTEDPEQLRKEFRGEMKINKITDEPDTAFSAMQRFPLYIKSVLICVPCLAVAIFVIICFLNATGVIRPEHHGGAFDIPMLSKLADQGAIFDPDSNACMILGIVQALVTLVMNLNFQSVARYTTEQENHKY